MVRSSKFIATLAIAVALAAGCGGADSKTPAGDAPSTFPGGTAGGTGTVAAPATGQPGGTGAQPDGAVPATAGHGKCVDRSSPVVTRAVAGLPKLYDGYGAARSTEANLGECPDLMYVHARLKGGTGSSPEWILFFDKQGYLGTATSRPTAFASVTGNTEDSVAVSYRWFRPGDTTATVSGGPITVTYRLTGRTVTPDRDVPPEAFGDGAATTTATTTAAPVSHCAEATPELLKSNAEANWGNQIAKPYTVDNVVCADEWASARIPMRPEYMQNTKLLFRYTGGGWSGVAFGSGFTCAEKGVPAATAAKLGC